MKKRNLILMMAVAVLFLALILSAPGMVRRAKTRAEKPDLSAETVTIAYIYKGTPALESSLAEQWDGPAVITDEKEIADLCKLLEGAIFDKEDTDRGLAPFWKLQFDEAEVTLCRARGWRQPGDLYHGRVSLIYEAAGEKTVWSLKTTQLQEVSDAIDALTRAPDAQMLQSVHVRRISDGAEFDLTGEQLDVAREVLEAVLHKTKRANPEVVYSQFKSTHEVIFTLSGGSVLTMLYSPPAGQYYPCYLSAHWSTESTGGPTAYYSLTESDNTFPALFEGLEEVP